MPKREVSNRISAAILMYARDRGLDVDDLCRDLPYTSDQLLDRKLWIENTELLTLWQRLEEHTGNAEVGREVGLYAMQQHTFGFLSTILRLSGSPLRLLQKADRLVHYFDPNRVLHLHHVGKTSAIVELKRKSGRPQNRYGCSFARGLLAGIPTLWQLPPATVEDLSCAVTVDHLPPIDGRVYEIDDSDRVFSHPQDNPAERREEGAIAEDGTFGVGEVVYGANACLYRVTWTADTTRAWWQRVFASEADVEGENVANLEQDLRDLEQMYEQLHRFSSRMESVVDERSVALESANSELAELADKLKRQSVLKSEFIADVSHELRTLISAIVGFAELLTSQIYGPLNERQHAACDRIVVNTHTLLHMINDMLDISRLQSGKLELALESVNLRQMLDESLAAIAALAEQKKLALLREIETEVPVSILADRTKIKQMLLNLLTNAIKYTDRGHIKVRLHCPAPGEVAFTVRDTGRGIDENDMPLLFEEYSRVGPNRPDGGTGLGLYLTRKMAELMGGRVEVVSKLDHGSAFTVVLPVRGEELNAIREIDENPSYLDPGRNRLKILVADSNQAAAQFLGLTIQAAGMQVSFCSDGRRLIAQVAEYRPHLLVLDPELKHEDGWNILRRLRETIDTAAIPVVVLGAAGQQELAAAHGAVAFFAKPYEKRELIDCLLSVLGVKEGAQ